MVIIISKKTKKTHLLEIEKTLKEKNFNFFLQEKGSDILYTIYGVIENDFYMWVKSLPYVKRVLENDKQFFYASTLHKRKNIFDFGKLKLRKDEILLFAGPCAIEDEEGLNRIAEVVKRKGAVVLRGGSFKPRTSPYSFQGLKEMGLKIHKRVAEKYNLLVMSELLDIKDLPLFKEYVDIIQIGSRNMQNYPLLTAVGKSKKPVLLKRGFGSTREEFLLALEYLLLEGNDKVILCERGVRGFETTTRYIFDPVSIIALKEVTSFPIVVDPSHSAGIAKYVPPIAKSAVVCGADGLLIEVHNNPPSALSDGQQSLNFKEFDTLVDEIENLSKLFGRRLKKNV